MKARILRDGRGNAVASIIDTAESANLVPLDVEIDEGDGGEMEEIRIRTRDLFDLDELHKRFHK